MALPKRVQEQAEQAKKAIEGMRRAPPEEGAKPQEQAPPANADQGQPETDWEKRFKNMKRSHDETVSELRSQNEQLSGQVEKLTALIEKSKTEEPAAQAPVFTPEEVEEYGQGFLDMVTRVAKSASSNASSGDIANELKELKGQFNNIVQNQVRTEEEKFYDELERAVPNWEAINEDERFHAWLAEEMPMTGNQRQHFLSQAQQRFDASTVKSFFVQWQREQSGESVLPDTKTTTNEYVGERGKETEIWTAADIDAFYKDKTLGRFRGREDEARQIEMRIFRAQNEGRVR